MRKEHHFEANEVRIIIFENYILKMSDHLKTCRILHSEGFTDAEMGKQKVIICTNVVTFMALIVKAIDNFSIVFEDQFHEVSYTTMISHV